MDWTSEFPHQRYINVLSATAAPITTLSIRTNPEELFHGSRLALLINPQNSLKIVCQNFYNSCAHSPVLDTIALHLPNVETVDVEGPGLSFDSSADPVLWNTPSLRRLYIKTAFGDTYPA